MSFGQTGPKKPALKGTGNSFFPQNSRGKISISKISWCNLYQSTWICIHTIARHSVAKKWQYYWRWEKNLISQKGFLCDCHFPSGNPLHVSWHIRARERGKNHYIRNFSVSLFCLVVLCIHEYRRLLSQCCPLKSGSTSNWNILSFSWKLRPKQIYI